VNVGKCSKTNIHGEFLNQTNSIDSACEGRECFSNSYACAYARAYGSQGPVKHSQHSQDSPDPKKCGFLTVNVLVNVVVSIHEGTCPRPLRMAQMPATPIPEEQRRRRVIYYSIACYNKLRSLSGQ
jgi:hypothetical protein